MQPLAPLIHYWSTPTRAGKLIADKLTERWTDTGSYYDENGKRIRVFEQVRDSSFSDQYIAETCALLAQAPTEAL